MPAIALSPTLEDYLEAIFHIASRNKVARSMEIADRLKVKRSSVTVALRSLAEKGLINYQVRSYVTLTSRGLATARCVDKRHHILLDLFENVLGLDPTESDTAACSMEHGMSEQVCKKLTALLLALGNDPVSAQRLRSSIETAARSIDCQSDCGYNPSSLPPPSVGEEELYNLNFMQPPQKGKIARILGTGVLKKRLQDMGLIRGEEISIIRAAPLDDPIEVKVRNCHLSLRRSEAALILVDGI